jgi:hypothetical protein
MDRFFSALITFFLVLFGQIFALAASEGFGHLHIDPFGSRNALFFVALGLSFSAAILRWRMLGARTKSVLRAEPVRSHENKAQQPAGANNGSAAFDPNGPVVAAAMARMAAQAETKPPPASVRSAEVMAAAARQAIVFRQHFPPRDEAGIRSFFGGAPLAPNGFLWPRAGDSNSQRAPLHFVMQIDCAAVPASARLGALPSRGVLYFFLDMSWEKFDFRVIHSDAMSDAKADSPHDEWQTIAPPADLGPVFGKQAVHVWPWALSAEHCPVLLPRWTFDPVVLELPEPVREEEDDEDEGGPVLWPQRSVADQLLRAQGDSARYDYLTIKDVVDGPSLRRPFASFPHDWRALQICSGELMRRAENDRRFPSMSTFRTLDKDAADALLAEIAREAQTWFDRAAAEPAFDEVPRADRDAFWEMLVRHSPVSRSILVEALTHSIEASYAHSARAAARVPSELAARIRGRHALAVMTDAGIHANIPDRMLAPPVDVQGNQWERAMTHLLLLEISSNEGLGHHFGEGVYQFWIRPEDLEAGRFDKVELTSDAY